MSPTPKKGHIPLPKRRSGRSEAARTEIARNSGPKSASAGPKPAKVPQPHGGAIYAGGVPGHRPGPGRPPNELREQLRDAAAARIAVYTDMADGVMTIPLRRVCEHCGEAPSAAPSDLELIEAAVAASDRRGAMDSMLRYGLGEQREILEAADVRQKLALTRDAIRATPHLSEPQASALLKQIAKVWG